MTVDLKAQSRGRDEFKVEGEMLKADFGRQHHKHKCVPVLLLQHSTPNSIFRNHVGSTAVKGDGKR